MHFNEEKNRITVINESGRVIASVDFPAQKDGRVNISHTYVDNSLRGQGVAGKLLHATADKLRQENTKAVATCSYAMKWFEEHPEYADVLL